MGKLKGFKEFSRTDESNIAVSKRVQNYNEFTIPLTEQKINSQGARCMDCGVPFCHSGCPLGNLIPDFNDMVYKGEWQKASELLHATNNFPEFTGRLCPAPCEKSCVLGIIDQPVSIENIEKNIVERAFSQGWIKPVVPKVRTGKTIAIIGSGPAGLACAQQLNRAGHTVTVFERDHRVGGLLRYGIPNFKLEKEIIDRRIDILKAEGIKFQTNTNIGENYSVSHLDMFDAVVLCTGATVKRELPIKGKEASGVIQAMDFLTAQTKSLEDNSEIKQELSAKGKNVIVIGGGDTGSDCIGTSNRHGAKSVTNFEIMPKPPKQRSESTPWPYWPLQLKTSSSHQEGCDRNWLIQTKEFIQNNEGKLTGLKTVNIQWVKNPQGKFEIQEVEGSEKVWDCDMVLLALGFVGAEANLATKLGIETDSRTNYKARNYQTNNSRIFVAGDIRKGQSLIVWAISEGREAARAVDTYLMGSSKLPSKGNGDMLNHNN